MERLRQLGLSYSTFAFHLFFFPIYPLKGRRGENKSLTSTLLWLACGQMGNLRNLSEFKGVRGKPTGSRWSLVVVFNESCTPLPLSKSLRRFIFLSGWNASSVFIVRKWETLYGKFKFLDLRKFDRSWSWSLMKRFKETKVRMLPGLRLARIRRYQSWSLSAEIFSVMHVQKDNRRKCSLLVLVKVLPRSNDRFSQFPDIQTCLRVPKG